MQFSGKRHSVSVQLPKHLPKRLFSQAIPQMKPCIEVNASEPITQGLCLPRYQLSGLIQWIGSCLVNKIYGTWYFLLALLY